MCRRVYVPCIVYIYFLHAYLNMFPATSTYACVELSNEHVLRSTSIKFCFEVPEDLVHRRALR